ncbi:MAG: hypothetical protein ACHREM_21160, partial [Polyangiales bacterium]
MKIVRAVSLAVAVCSIAFTSGCAQNETSLKNEWTSLSVDWAGRTNAIGKSITALTAKVTTLPKGAAGRASIDAALKADQDAATALAVDFVGLKKEADEIFEHGTRDGIIESVERLKSLTASASELNETIAEESRLLDEAKERAEKTVKEAAEAAKIAQAAAAARATLFAKILKDGGGAEVTGIEFVPGKADLAVDVPSVVSALDALVAFSATCDDLRFELGVTSPKGADAAAAEKLAGDRATTLKKYL